MEEKKKTWVNWLLEWSTPQKPLYLWSVLLAAGNVILKMPRKYVHLDQSPLQTGKVECRRFLKSTNPLFMRARGSSRLVPCYYHRLGDSFAVRAYFRQLSMQELYNVTTQLEEEVLFQIGYRADITASHTIKFRGIEYDIIRIDPFEGYKTDLKLYCKRKS